MMFAPSNGGELPRPQNAQGASNDSLNLGIAVNRESMRSKVVKSSTAAPVAQIADSPDVLPEHPLSQLGAGRFWKSEEERKSKKLFGRWKGHGRSPSQPAAETPAGEDDIQFANSRQETLKTMVLGAGNANRSTVSLSAAPNRPSFSQKLPNVSSPNLTEAGASVVKPAPPDDRARKTMLQLMRLQEMEDARLAQLQSAEDDSTTNESTSTPSRNTSNSSNTNSSHILPPSLRPSVASPVADFDIDTLHDETPGANRRRTLSKASDIRQPVPDNAKTALGPAPLPSPNLNTKAPSAELEAGGAPMLKMPSTGGAFVFEVGGNEILELGGEDNRAVNQGSTIDTEPTKRQQMYASTIAPVLATEGAEVAETERAPDPLPERTVDRTSTNTSSGSTVMPEEPESHDNDLDSSSTPPTAAPESQHADEADTKLQPIFSATGGPMSTSVLDESLGNGGRQTSSADYTVEPSSIPILESEDVETQVIEDADPTTSEPGKLCSDSETAAAFPTTIGPDQLPPKSEQAVNQISPDDSNKAPLPNPNASNDQAAEQTTSPTPDISTSAKSPAPSSSPNLVRSTTKSSDKETAPASADDDQHADEQTTSPTPDISTSTKSPAASPSPNLVRSTTKSSDKETAPASADDGQHADDSRRSSDKIPSPPLPQSSNSSEEEDSLFSGLNTIKSRISRQSFTADHPRFRTQSLSYIVASQDRPQTRPTGSVSHLSHGLGLSSHGSVRGSAVNHVGLSISTPSLVSPEFKHTLTPPIPEHLSELSTSKSVSRRPATEQFYSSQPPLPQQSFPQRQSYQPSSLQQQSRIRTSRTSSETNPRALISPPLQSPQENVEQEPLVGLVLGPPPPAYQAVPEPNWRADIEPDIDPRTERPYVAPATGHFMDYASRPKE